MTMIVCYSRIRDLQDVQVTGHRVAKGEPYFLRVMRVMWLKKIRDSDQERFPGPSWTEKEGGVNSKDIELVKYSRIYWMQCRVCNRWRSYISSYLWVYVMNCQIWIRVSH